MGTCVQGRGKGPLNWAWRAESPAGWLCVFRFCTMELQTPASLSSAPPRLLLSFPLSMLPPTSFHYHLLWTLCLLATFSTCPSYSLPSSKTSSQDLFFHTLSVSILLHSPSLIMSPCASTHPSKVVAPQRHALGPVYWSPLKSSFLPIASSLCSKPIFLSLFL